MESADWNKKHFVRVVSDLLYVAVELILNLQKSFFLVCCHVHLVDADNQLFDAQREGQQSVLPGLTVGGDPSLELSSVGRHNQHAAIGLQQHRQLATSAVQLSNTTTENRIRLVTD